jgi:hypothetical protein
VWRRSVGVAPVILLYPYAMSPYAAKVHFLLSNGMCIGLKRHYRRGVPELFRDPSHRDVAGIPARWHQFVWGSRLGWEDERC